MRSCPSCHAKVADAARFCGNCGKSVPDEADVTRTSVPGDAASGAEGFGGPGGADRNERFAPGMLLGGRYRILGPIGRGGMGEVFRADDVKLGQSVALKFLPAALAADPDRLRRFLQEVRVARQVSHANVCRVYDIGEIDGQHFISMEYVDGEDLASSLRRMGRVSSERATEIARQICAGLHAAHAQGIVHRDLKPANIMLDGRGQVRITDFGLAGLAEEFEGNEVRVGTPAYMSPEQLAGREVSLRSDIYSLGLVLYELFTGSKAFDAPSIAEISRLQQESMPSTPTTLVSDIDPQVERTILRCLEKSPADRPDSALSVAASLPGGDPLAAALAAGETPSPQMVADAGRSEGVHPGVAAAMFGVFLVALVALFAMAGDLRSPNFFPQAKPPAALVADARAIVTEFGHGETPVADRYGYYAIDTDYQSARGGELRGADAWRDLGDVRPSPLVYVYRQSPQPIVASRAAGPPSAGNPPLILAGMINVQLDGEGRLLRFTAVPEERRTDGGDLAAEPDWDPVLRRIGVDPASVEAAEPLWNPLVEVATRRAWTARYPGREETVHIDAGAYAGRVQWARVSADWTTPDRTARPPDGVQQWINVVVISTIALMIAVGILLARRNIRMGRSDTRGALRLGLFMLGVSLVTWLLTAHHIASAIPELFLLMNGLQTALFLGGMVWVFYVAIEPYARRLWPDTLITWTRLLAGRWRDPWVGRDVALGIACGSLMAVLVGLNAALPAWLGKTATAPSHASVAALGGVRQALGIFVGLVPTGMILPIAIVLLLVLFRMVFRRRWIAVGLLFVLMSALQAVQAVAGTEDAAVRGLIVLTSALIWLMLMTVIVRRGMLAAVVAVVFANALATVPLTTDGGAWYVPNALITLVPMILLSGLAAWTSLGGRRVAFDDLLQE